MRAFVIAMADEADAVRPFLKDDDQLYVSGIGKVNAAATAAEAIKDGAKEVVNVGFCGGFGEKMNVGDVYRVKAAVEYDFDLAKLNHTEVGVKDGRTSPYIPVGDEGLVLATGDRFTDDDGDLALFRKLGCELRDMEGAAIADVCNQRGVKFVSIKCVTNVHGKGSMVGQFEENRAFCAKKLAAKLREWL